MPEPTPDRTPGGLTVSSLSVEYTGGHGGRAVDGVSYTVQAGQSLGVVGESGCGKSTAVRASIKLLPANGRIVAGTVLWNGMDLVTANAEAVRAIRWREISLVPQASMNSLNPVQRVGNQIVEVLRFRGGLDKEASRARAEELALLVGMDPGRLRGYPHQLSGGMRQRSVIAMALALHPKLLVADEATTGLDAIVQRRILNRLAELQAEQRFSVIYVSHDLALIREHCQRIQVMYAGQIVETGTAEEVYLRPSHPYTMALRAAVPDIRERVEKLVTIPGSPPSLREPVANCRFAARCHFATQECRDEPPPVVATSTGMVICHHADRAEEFRATMSAGTGWESSDDSA